MKICKFYVKNNQYIINIYIIYSLKIKNLLIIGNFKIFIYNNKNKKKRMNNKRHHKKMEIIQKIL